MIDQEDKNNETELPKIVSKLKKIFSDVLAVGDWESSIFLKNAAAKIRELQNRLEKIDQGKIVENQVAAAGKVDQQGELAQGVIKVFVLLYQVDGTNIEWWYKTIKSLQEYNVTRPVYKDESYAEEFIRSKVSNVERNGYVAVYVNEKDLYKTGTADSLGHQLFTLRENAIVLENVIEFVHANKNRYKMGEGELILLDQE
jgi:Dot/Icm secretion system protein IcmQ